MLSHGHAFEGEHLLQLCVFASYFASATTRSITCFANFLSQVTGVFSTTTSTWVPEPWVLKLAVTLRSSTVPARTRFSTAPSCSVLVFVSATPSSLNAWRL